MVYSRSSGQHLRSEFDGRHTVLFAHRKWTNATPADITAVYFVLWDDDDNTKQLHADRQPWSVEVDIHPIKRSLWGESAVCTAFQLEHNDAHPKS